MLVRRTQGLGIGAFHIQVSPSFRQDLEDGHPPELVTLTDHGQVLARQRLRSGAINLDGLSRTLVPGASGREFGLRGEPGGIVGGSRACPLRARHGRISLIPVQDGNRHHRAGGPIVELPPHALETAARPEPTLREAGIHAHVVSEEADIEAAS